MRATVSIDSTTTATTNKIENDFVIDFSNFDVKKFIAMISVSRYYDGNKRRATDKNWCGSFVILFIAFVTSWTVYCQYVIHRHPDPDVHYDTITTEKTKLQLLTHETNEYMFSHNITGAGDYTEFFHHERYYTISSRNDKLEKLSVQEYFKEFFHCILATFTCNPTFFVKNLKQLNEKESFRFMFRFYYVLITTTFFLFGLLFIRFDKKIVSKQPSVVATVFLFIVLIEHLSIMCHLIHSEVYSSSLFHQKLIYWVVPESAVLAILISKMFSTVHNKDTEDTNAINRIKNVSSDDNSSDDKSVIDVSVNSYNDEFVTSDGNTNESANNDGNNDDSTNNTDKTSDDDDEKDNSVYRIIPFHYYIYAIIFGFPFIIILKLLIMTTLSVLDKVGWRSAYFYVIAILSFFVGRTIYYYGMMLTTVATDILIESGTFTLRDLKRAICIITRYHFGTVCYHATPTISDQRCYLLREEFKDDKKWCRMVSKYNGYYRLTRTITASHGHNYYDSISELLHLVNKIRMEDYFSSIGDMFSFAFFLLLPSNNLMHILLWYYECYDEAFANASVVMYLSIAFMFYFAMQFFKAVSDTIGLRLCEKYMKKMRTIAKV